MFIAGLLLFQAVGLWFGGVSWPIVLTIFGLAIAIDTSGFNYERSLEDVVGSGRRPWWLVLAGLAMMVVGLAFVLTSLDALESMGALVVAIIVTLTGFFIVGGPWLWSVARDLGTERRARRDGGPPPRLCAPVPRPHPALRRPKEDGHSGPRPRTRSPGLAV